MAKKKAGATPASLDRHKPRRMVPIAEPIYLAFRELAQKRFRSVSKEVERWMQEELEREGMWPPATGTST